MRRARLAAILLSATLAGCWTQTIGGPAQATGGGTDGGTVESFQIVPSDGQLDLLFVIDDSGGAAAQQKLAEQIPALMKVLDGLPGGLPDLHVGVVSADLGAGSDAPTGNPLPCWAAGPDGSTPCPAGRRPFYVEAPRELADQAGLIYDVSCPLCDTNRTVAGCR